MGVRRDDKPHNSARTSRAASCSKGKVSRALAGKGEGFDIGVAISDFRIAKPSNQPK